jgi:hypothetical protein
MNIGLKRIRVSRRVRIGADPVFYPQITHYKPYMHKPGASLADSRPEDYRPVLPFVLLMCGVCCLYLICTQLAELSKTMKTAYARMKPCATHTLAHAYHQAVRNPYPGACLSSGRVQQSTKVHTALGLR